MSLSSDEGKIRGMFGLGELAKHHTVVLGDSLLIQGDGELVSSHEAVSYPIATVNGD